MEYIRLGKTGLKISRIGLGCWNYGNSNPRWGKPGKVGAEAAINIIHQSIDKGINFFDTANRYTGGESEEILGKAIKGHRDKLVIATKVHGQLGPGPNESGQSRYHIMREVEGSLRRLNIDCIDLYQAHGVDWNTPLEESLRAYDDLIRQGKVRYIGCSNFPAWVLAKALWVSDVNKFASYVSVQPNYSLVNRAVEKELQPLCVDQGIGMVLYSPIGGGILTGKYEESIPEGSRGAEEPEVAERAMKLQDGVKVLKRIAQELGKTPAQVSLNWVINRPAVSSAIMGVSRVEHLEDNIGAVGWKLSEEHVKQLDEAFPVS
ncbi:Predicted oxidoreductase [Paenibacillus sp. yr247]|uniref:aldo/keto reductase n=1 Tax=Paenibacillus sp. yr247 TaxID=1761880 RepID=UPI000891E77B|nr:aldo/keto reductase [Paenibacillus sp. yr247]SDP29898.1 Predicted oxidoreductase [Paenibacillus sp. yr247]